MNKRILLFFVASHFGCLFLGDPELYRQFDSSLSVRGAYNRTDSESEQSNVPGFSKLPDRGFRLYITAATNEEGINIQKRQLLKAGFEGLRPSDLST